MNPKKIASLYVPNSRKKTKKQTEEAQKPVKLTEKEVQPKARLKAVAKAK